jgi:hypothetical protein
MSIMSLCCCDPSFLNLTGVPMSKKTAKKRAVKSDVEPIVPPDGFVLTSELRFIDGQLHQKFVPHANIGGAGEHWQPVEAWETGEEGDIENTGSTGQS